jgi:putative hydrolase of the HAD superfamily
MEYFEVVIISSEAGVCKPDERIFRMALDQATVDPARCLYVGDNYYDDAVGATSVGMKSLIVNRFGSLGVEELTAQELISDISGILPLLGDV